MNKLVFTTHSIFEYLAYVLNIQQQITWLPSQVIYISIAPTFFLSLSVKINKSNKPKQKNSVHKPFHRNCWNKRKENIKIGS